MAQTAGSPPVKRAPRVYYGCSRLNDYEVMGKLGEGTFGEVHKARSLKTGSVVALKKILMHNEKDGFPITALREIKLLKMLSHPNVLKLEEMAVERVKGPGGGNRKGTCYMVTPYMEHDLSGLLDNPDVRFTEPQIKCYMLQLFEGLRYLHSMQILHRDMKAANLLISNRGILQIADFGLARHYDEPPPRPGRGGGEASRDYTALVVTRWYRPPELLLQLRRYTTAIDMWGAGCVFGEMFKRKPILAGNSDLNQAHIIFDLVGNPTDESMPGWRSLPGCEGTKEWTPRSGNLAQVFRDQSPQAISLLKELLKLDWRKRINAIDALEHPYFKTDPKPAKPEDLPRFQDSHELDRRNARGQRAAPPPAPAGGSVGMGPNGEWTGSGGPNGPNGAWVNGGDRGSRPGWQQDRGSQGMPPSGHRMQDGRGPPHGVYDRDPPGRRPAWQGEIRDNHRHGYDQSSSGHQRHGLPPPPPEGRHQLPHPPVQGFRNNTAARVDTYIPSYSEGGRREDRHSKEPDSHPSKDGRRGSRDSHGSRDSRPPSRGERGMRDDYRDRDRGIDRREYPSRDRRTRSRSPAREQNRARERERDVYRR